MSPTLIRKALRLRRQQAKKAQAQLIHARRAFFAKEQEAIDLEQKLKAVISVRIENLFDLDPDLWQVSVRIDKRVIRLSNQADIIRLIATDIYRKLAS